jgi:hypothetical protein
MTSQLSRVEQKLNQLHAQKAALTHKTRSKSKQERMLRTRTLIQVGGIISITGLLEKFNIELGEDLQSDTNQMDKAAVLLGVFMRVMEQIPNDLTSEEINALKQKGITKMNMHNSEYVYKTNR